MNPQDFIRVIVLVLIAWIVFSLIMVIHETGHLIGYMLCTKNKSANWHIVVGRGKQLLRIKRLTICLIPFAGFFQLAEPDAHVTKKTALITLAGGPIASLLMTIVLFALHNSRFAVLSDSISNFIVLLSFYQFVCTIIPLRYPAWLCAIPESDGLKIMRLLKKSK